MRRNSRRRGVVLYTLLGVLVIVAILAISLNSLTVQKTRQSRYLTDGQDCMLLGRSLAGYAVAIAQEALENQTSPLFLAIMSGTLRPGELLPLDFPAIKSILSDFRNASGRVSLKLLATQPIRPAESSATSGFDAAEQRMKVEIVVTCSAGLAEMQHQEIREFRVINLCPDILGKFTLFIRSITDPEALNKFACHIDGYPDSSFSAAPTCLPVILKNGGELDSAAAEAEDLSSWKKRGYVYLGDDAVNLNLTSGNFDAFGELFHFYRLNREAGIPGYFHPFPPPFFAAPPDFAHRVPQQLNSGPQFSDSFAYILKHVVSGFYTTQDNCADMNFAGRLDVSLPSGSADSRARMRSSSLHLYGTRTNPSPTLVLGNVSRRYADYAAVVVDATGDAQRDAILEYVKETREPLGSLPLPPDTVYAVAGSGLPPETPIRIDNGVVNFQSMFASEDLYRQHACSLKIEPYLRSHDFMYFRNEEQFFPEKSQFGDPTAKFQNSFAISLKGKDAPYFSGAPADFPADPCKEKTVYRVAGFSEFSERFISRNGSELNLGTILMVAGSEKDRHVLPADLKVVRGGILLFEHGNVEISGISRADPDEVLTIIALNGNIDLNLSGQSQIQASLAALNGSIRNMTPERGLDLKGSFISAAYEPLEFKNGGRIAFDSRTDPSGVEYLNYYRCFVADFPESARRSFSL